MNIITNSISLGSDSLHTRLTCSINMLRVEKAQV